MRPSSRPDGAPSRAIPGACCAHAAATVPVRTRTPVPARIAPAGGGAAGAPVTPGSIQSTALEAATASVSGNDICRICFRFFAVNCCLWSTLVRWCPLLSAAIVTQLVTRLHARGQTDPLLVGSVCAAGQPTSSPVRRRLAVRECLSTRRRFQAEAGNCPLRRARAPGRQRRSALVRATERYPRGVVRRVRLAP